MLQSLFYQMHNLPFFQDHENLAQVLRDMASGAALILFIAMIYFWGATLG